MQNTNKNIDKARITEFISRLNIDEYNYLMYYLKSNDKIYNIKQGILSASELLMIETWLFEHIENAKNNKTRLARQKIWAIFIFLRYAALAPAEIFTLTENHLDLANGIIHVTGRHSRIIYLPFSVCRRLRKIFAAGELSSHQTYPLRCDSGFLRHSLKRCAVGCALEKGLVNARTIRNSRLCELKNLGLPHLALDILTGIAGSAKNANQDHLKMSKRLLQEYCQMESPMKTSARNVFQGRVQSVKQAGFMVRVSIRTCGGLNIAALITDKSYQRLQIEPGKILTASIKAPWVNVQPMLEDTATLLSSHENSFIGTVETVRTDTLLAEITAVLADGSIVCSLQEIGPFLPKTGDRVFVLIKALAVVLHADLG